LPGDEERLMTRWIIAAIALAQAACGACAQTGTVRVDDVWRDAFMTGSESVEALMAADGAGSVRLPGGRCLWLMGDSLIGKVVAGRVGSGAGMARNAIIVTPATPEAPPMDAVVRLWGPPPAESRTGWLTPEGDSKPPRWCWPVGGAVILDRAGGAGPKLAIFYADMAQRDPAADDCWNFRQVGNRVAVVENAAEAPQQWKVRQVVLWSSGVERPRQTNWGSAAMPDPASRGDASAAVLIFGTDGTDVLNKGAVLARAPAGKLEDFSAWQFWSRGHWSAQEADATPVVRDIADEFSVHDLPADGRPRVVMVHSEGRLGRRILARTAPHPVGPWNEPATLYLAPEPASGEGVMVYGAKAHPEVSAPGELLVTYAVNSTDFAGVLSHISLYRPRFLRVPLSALEAPAPAPEPEPLKKTLPRR
jgi:hypothetical protein